MGDRVLSPLPMFKLASRSCAAVALAAVTACQSDGPRFPDGFWRGDPQQDAAAALERDDRRFLALRAQPADIELPGLEGMNLEVNPEVDFRTVHLGVDSAQRDSAAAYARLYNEQILNARLHQRPRLPPN